MTARPTVNVAARPHADVVTAPSRSRREVVSDRLMLRLAIGAAIILPILHIAGAV